jgi:hypothetical protein
MDEAHGRQPGGYAPVETTLHAQHAPARRDTYFRLGTSSRVTVNSLLKAVGMLLLFF